MIGTPTTPSNELTQKTRHQARNDTKLPVAKIRPMTAGPSTLSRQNHDLQNKAIKSLFAQNPKIHSSPQIRPSTTKQTNEGSVQVVKVREAWAPLPEEAAKLTEGVVRRVPRERSNDAENDAINNNGNEGEEDQRKTEVN